jgi:Raf kinase inhibitor-like YbhB/YbcL family protein
MTNATGLSQDLLPQIAYFILGSFTMRVSLTGAMHFIAQLPEYLREALLKLPAGPDKFISSRTITEELVSRFHLTESYARIVLHRFIRGLFSWMSPEQLENLRSQLPQDFNPYFEPLTGPTEILSLGPKSSAPATLYMTSPVFPDGGEIPKTYTGEGLNRSPQIEWSKVPQGTKEFALICEDPDAPTTTPWIHWCVYGITNSVTQLQEGLSQDTDFLASILARQGKNTSGSLGYIGPLPPKKDNWHRYYFRLYALDREITLPEGATADELRDEMKGHILGEGTLMGRYRRAHRDRAAA